MNSKDIILRANLNILEKICLVLWTTIKVDLFMIAYATSLLIKSIKTLVKEMNEKPLDPQMMKN